MYGGRGDGSTRGTTMVRIDLVLMAIEYNPEKSD